MNPTDLFAALHGIPDLPGARCAGRWELFDATDPASHSDDVEFAQHVALELCSRCQVLTACGEWLESLPPARRPVGVVAGAVRRPRPPRQRTATS